MENKQCGEGKFPGQQTVTELGRIQQPHPCIAGLKLKLDNTYRCHIAHLVKFNTNLYRNRTRLFFYGSEVSRTIPASLKEKYMLDTSRYRI